MATSVDQDSINVLSLCTGGGGLELGLKLASEAFRVVCCVEHEAYCCEVLATRMEEKALDDAPIWTDLRAFDGCPWRGIVDVVTAGYPCQPFSCAGKRKGEDDPRHLWPHIRRIAEECQPELVFLENVPGHLNLGFDSVLSDLREMGFRVAAGLFTAAEVGASHRRQRLFILGHCPSARCNEARGGQSVKPQCGECVLGDRCGDVADAPNSRQQEDAATSTKKDRPANTQRDAGELPGRLGGSCSDLVDACRSRGRRADAERQGQGTGLSGNALRANGNVADTARSSLKRCVDRSGKEQSGRNCADVADTGSGRWHPIRDATGCTGQVGRLSGNSPQREAEDSRCGSVPLLPPGPRDIELWREILEVAPSLEPAVRGVADGMAPRVDRLRMLGNGVVPLQAAYAFCSLAACLLGEDGDWELSIYDGRLSIRRD